jgi:DNA-binding CsgD family transcriptional regulator
VGRRFGPLELDEVERRELRSLASRRSTAQGLALRARIILACAEGEQSKVVAARLGIDPETVRALRAEITSFIEHHNADPKPFRWTKSANDILSSIERFCAYNLPAKA